LRVNLKYILPFFIAFSFLIAEDHTFSTYNFSDYIRLSEWVQAGSSIQIPTKYYYFVLCKMPIEKNPYIIFQCNDLYGYFEHHIKLILVLQKRISGIINPRKWLIAKFKNPNDIDKDYPVDIRCKSLISKSCISYRFMHDQISNEWALIYNQRCLKLSRISYGYLIFSSDLLNGLYELFT
jgi:hypothetical protein